VAWQSPAAKQPALPLRARAAILITHLAARIALADRVITLSERRITAPVSEAPSRATKLSGSDR